MSAPDELRLTDNAMEVLRRRYLLKNADGRIAETPEEMFKRVAKAVAAVDASYGADPGPAEEAFYASMVSRDFMPNSPTLMNAGTAISQLSACFVLPVEDSMDGIFGSLKNMALIHQSGGGTGFSFSRLRPAEDIVKSTSGVASGPVSFMSIYDAATNVVKQGGRRRGANMGILRVDHPDILEFIDAKLNGSSLNNFNLSVAVTDDFMAAVERHRDYKLISPRTGQVAREVNAAKVFDRIVENAWRTGDPGLIFIDEINRRHPLAALGEIESTNPCGELPLLPYESCNLGSINLGQMLGGAGVDWEKLKDAVETAVHFLDNVIDAGRFPVPEITEITRANRKIGLGVMGFADMLIDLDVPYSSEEAVSIAEKLGAFIEKTAVRKSVELAGDRGSFPNFSSSSWAAAGYARLRNATLTTVAPTGTISIIAGASSGIEPLFAVSYVRTAMNGLELHETNRAFERLARERGVYSDKLVEEITGAASIQEIERIPKDMRDLFQTNFDISGEQHVKIQAAWQKNVDNAVSKTVNLPEDATIDDVRGIYLLAHRLKCKGTTIYRYGSKREQVLSVERKRDLPDTTIKAEVEYGGGCAAGECAF